MTTAGRTISFDDCIQVLDRGEGTLIQEWKTRFTGPTRCWWTRDDLFTNGPFPVGDRAAVTPGSNAPRSTQSCFDEYIDVLDGKALLVVVEKQQRKRFRETVKNAARIDVLTHTSEGW